MAESSLFLFLAVVAVALIYDFSNGLNDAANAIATVISTRVLSPLAALGMSAFFNFAGAMLGLEVARTVGKGIVSPEEITQLTVVAGALGGALWVFLATRYGLPLSVTHSLIGGLIGAGIATAGFEAILWPKLTGVLLSIVIAPVLGFAGGFVIRTALAWILRKSTPYRVESIFGKLQILSAAFMSFSHGRNDAQNARGLIMLGLVVYSGQMSYWDSPPWWVYVVPALVMMLGTAWGGWRVIRTLGVRVTNLRPVDGFSAETAGALVIEVASQLGIPVSTTHCITGAIMGTGSTKRFSAVRWGVGRTIAAAWIITIPICALLGYLLTFLINLAV
ncbi:MAG: inorganic phosphate transporter [Dehalococcoidales bacterium]|nr:inorganic phosphate transporter [Dehalococcoidales bacterium]